MPALTDADTVPGRPTVIPINQPIKTGGLIPELFKQSIAVSAQSAARFTAMAILTDESRRCHRSAKTADRPSSTTISSNQDLIQPTTRGRCIINCNSSE
jgi:hypothetical protein